MLTNGVPAGNRPTGKCVEIHHHLFDQLWNIGTRKIDAAILMAAPEAEAAAEQDANDQSDEERKGDAQDGGVEPEERKGASADDSNDEDNLDLDAPAKLISAAAADDD